MVAIHLRTHVCVKGDASLGSLGAHCHCGVHIRVHVRNYVRPHVWVKGGASLASLRSARSVPGYVVLYFLFVLMWSSW